jgi:hypothetical protein
MAAWGSAAALAVRQAAGDEGAEGTEDAAADSVEGAPLGRPVAWQAAPKPGAPRTLHSGVGYMVRGA